MSINQTQKTESILAAIEAKDTALRKAIAAIKPLSDCVFNDNGDMAVDMRQISRDERISAYFALATIERALKEGE